MGHRDFDVEKKLRRDLKRTHALLADAQLLLSTVDNQGQNLPNGSREQLERLHCQVHAAVHSFVSGCRRLLLIHLLSVPPISWRRAKQGGWRLRAFRKQSPRNWRTLRLS